ncbi:NHL repeat-containing protein [Bdellovibrio sp. BCCA]|uniref:NHL repeat-containing protein n=1 Tax=Bdellovibrio sp. BCCA TaxID=3136281 RepID=UPI0030F01116
MSNVFGILFLVFTFALVGCSLEAKLDPSSLVGFVPDLTKSPSVSNKSSFDGLSLGRAYQGYEPYGIFHLERRADGKLLAMTMSLSDMMGGGSQGILRISPVIGTLEQKSPISALHNIAGPNARTMGVDGRFYFAQEGKVYRISPDFSTVEEVVSISQQIATVGVDSSSSVYFSVPYGTPLNYQHLYKWVAGNPVVFAKQADGVSDYLFAGYPQKILIDNNDKVYVYDVVNTGSDFISTMTRFSSSGVFEQSFPIGFTDYAGKKPYARDLNWDKDRNNIIAVGVPQTVATSYVAPYKIGVYSKTGVLQSSHTANIFFDGYTYPTACVIDDEVFIGNTNGIFAYHLIDHTIRWIGSGGTGNGEFAGFLGDGLNGAMSIDSHDNVYIADIGNFRIQKFNSQGVYQSSIATGSDYPRGLTLTKDDRLVYLGKDSQQTERNHMVSLNSSMQVVSTVTKTVSEADDAWLDPKRMAVNSQGHRYVVDLRSMSINGTPYIIPVRIFDEAGNYIGKISMPDLGGSDVSMPTDIFIDAEDSVWISKMHKIEKYDSQHNLVKTLDGFGYIIKFAMDKRGYIYVVDIDMMNLAASSVKIYDETGTFVSQIDSTTPGLETDPLRVPVSVAVDSKYRIYVSDGTNRIRRFTPVTASP